MLEYLSHFEGVQTMFIFGLGVIGLTFAIGYNIRRAMLVKDVEQENEMRRKIQWHNIQNERLIDVKRGAEGE